MLTTLERALQQVDNLPVDMGGLPVNANDGIVGHWQLENAVVLAVEAMSKVARTSGKFLTYDEVQRCLNAKDQRPIAPNPDDPQFDPPHISYDSPEERQIARAYRYQQAYKSYEQTLQTYQKTAAETDKIRRSFGYGLAHYLGYAQHALAGLEASPDGETPVDAVAAFLSKKRCLPIPEAAAEYGTFIVGNHGSGKSEVIKQRVWHYLNKPNARETIVVIDPHGEMAPEIARMKPNYGSDRLVYIDPTLDAGFTPCPDLLNTPDKSPDNLFREAEFYGSALRMMAGNMEASTTGNMESLCRNCAHVVLEHDQFNLADLLDLLAVEAPKKGQLAPDPPPILEAALKGSVNSRVQRHFEHQFMSSRYSMAKSALYGRIERIIAAPMLQRMLLNPPTFNVGELIEQRKVIVINLPFKDLSKPVTAMIGQLIMAQIMLAVLKRDFSRIKEYPPVHIYIDEAQHLVSHETAEQINEFRKFGFNLTLATQYVDQFPADILEAVKGLGVQIAGFCEGKNLAAMNSIFDLTSKTKDLDETVLLKNQTVGQFHIKSRGAEGAPPIKTRQFTTDTNLIFKGAKWRKQNADRYMTDAEWAETRAIQLKRYYRANSALPSERFDGNATSPQTRASDHLSPLAPDKGYND
ncbi:helicase HerA domain-containing protein [Halocynthiibacter sp.]|uniref:helicase HerA domain-containing protein n=1 Tax=Halocynthiibacter sp. TaxID=1979210 RepID=UPI003C506145